MKFCTYFLISGLSVFSMDGQNLIPNPGFDSVSSCPYDKGQIEFAIHWTSATNSKPDLYNECSPSDYRQVPNAGTWVSSYQLQRSGTGYAAIQVYYSGGNSDGNSDYLMCQLNGKMTSNQVYYIEFYVSPDFTLDHGDMFSGDVGLALSDTMVYATLKGTEALNLEPVIEHSGSMIRDTVGWTKISGCYIADGNEAYAIVGNFKSASETNIEVIRDQYPHLNHFYVEDVAIVPFDPLPDTILLCIGSPLMLNGGFRDATYLWNTGETDSVISVSESGIYSVEAMMENCVLSDTAVVIDVSMVRRFPADTQICEGESAQLVAPLPGSYKWSDGSENRELRLSETGFYELTVTNECGEFTYQTYAEVKSCACNFFVPSAFSPNNNGVNDKLEVYAGCDYDFDILSFEVYNRWGERVYQSTANQVPSWDGASSGEEVDDGIYVWSLKVSIYKDNEVPEMHVMSGDVLLSR